MIGKFYGTNNENCQVVVGNAVFVVGMDENLFDFELLNEVVIIGTFQIVVAESYFPAKI